jgi:hypothetical protein
VLWLPLAASVPLQPPDAVHDVASIELHVNVEEPPLATVVGAALRDAVGCVIGVTPTPPQAANSRDTPMGKKRITDSRKVRFALSRVLDRDLNWFDRIETHPTKHELNVIESPYASRNRAMLRWSLNHSVLACSGQISRVSCKPTLLQTSP